MVVDFVEAWKMVMNAWGGLIDSSSSDAF